MAKKNNKFLDENREAIADALGTGKKSLRLVEQPEAPNKYQYYRKASGLGHIAVGQIVADKQARTQFHEEKLRELAESFKSVGQQQPAIVRWDAVRGKYVLIAGERRWRAAKIASLDTLLCQVAPEGIAEAEVRELQLIENLQRENLNDIELAHAYRDYLKNAGGTAKDLAKRIGRHPSTVTRCLKLLELPQDVQKQVADGRIPKSVARELSRLDSETEQRELLAANQTEKLDIGDTARRASQKSRKRRKPQRVRQVFQPGDGWAFVVTGTKPTTYAAMREAAERVLEEITVREENNVAL